MSNDKFDPFKPINPFSTAPLVATTESAWSKGVAASKEARKKALAEEARKEAEKARRAKADKGRSEYGMGVSDGREGTKTGGSRLSGNAMLSALGAKSTTKGVAFKNAAASESAGIGITSRKRGAAETSDKFNPRANTSSRGSDNMMSRKLGADSNSSKPQNSLKRWR